MVYKKYKNPELEKKLSEIIPLGTYGQFGPLVIDILLRRAYEFDLTEEEILNDAKNLRKNVKTIGFEDRKKIKLRYNGMYDHDHKTILINKTQIKKRIIKMGGNPNDFSFVRMQGEYIYKILAHEVFHGIAAHKYGTALDRDKECDGINEGFNEAAANRCVSKYSLADVKRCYTKTDSYSILTIIPKLLANIAGVSEKEILSSGIKGREATDAVSIALGKNLRPIINGRPSKEKTDNILTIFTKSASVIHNLMYNIDGATNLKPGTKKTYEIGGAIISTLISNSRKATYDFIRNDKRSPEEINPQELAYRYNAFKKIYAGLCDQMKKKKFVDSNSLKNIESNEKFIEADKKLMNQIAGMILITENKERLGREFYNKFYNEFKQGDIRDISSLSFYGINVPEDIEKYLNDYDCSEYEQKIIKEDFESFVTPYDNSNIKSGAARLFLSKNNNLMSGLGFRIRRLMNGNPKSFRNDIFRLILKIKEKVDKRHSRQLMLPKDTQNRDNTGTKANNPWKVDPKDLNRNNTKTTKKTQNTNNRKNNRDIDDDFEL